MTERFVIDPKITAFDQYVYDTPLIQDVWKEKYYQKVSNETHPNHVFARVSKAISESSVEENSAEAFNLFYEAMTKRLFLPGGRILAGAGTGKRVTLMNCYVNGELEDSIEGIADGKKRLLITSAMGGGIGTDFSPLRPHNAQIAKLGSASSGVVSFMDTFNADGKTIRSAGERRAAQMGTLCDTHPDLPEFIKAKGEGLKDGTGRLKEFNLSVWVSDAFMAAVDEDAKWPLFFHIPPVSREADLEKYDFIDDDGVKQYVYSIWSAKELWKLITEYTYEFSDPGVIFGDRVNDQNNLSYVETIKCTNPCGEQPLPPHGTCNLGAINVANFVTEPFTPQASVNYQLLAQIAKVGVRFLDNVINVTSYPLKEQQDEEYNKRRIGLGILGLGTLFAELGIKYGSQASVDITNEVMKTIAVNAYEASIELARERGSFPLFDPVIVDSYFIDSKFDDETKEKILDIGLRNGVILTIAPVGTGSIAFANVSSGLEPDFSHEYERRVRQNNTEEFKTYVEKSYSKRFYEFCTGNSDTPDYMTTATDIEILDHIKIQAACQRWVDASVSKTINIPEDLPYEKFLEVYQLAYKYGCKGCTTYRHSKYRESILSTKKSNTVIDVNQVERPEEISGTTYKIDWPSMSASMYVTINYLEDRPYEIFFASKDAKFQDWMTGITLMISAILRSGVDPSFIPYELKQVVSAHDTGWYNQKHYGSLVARIGSVIESDFIKHNVIKNSNKSVEASISVPKVKGSNCPSCNSPTLYHMEGCKKCTQCGYSSC